MRVLLRFLPLVAVGLAQNTFPAEDLEPSEQDTCPPRLDIAFVIDTSGSDDDIDEEHVRWTTSLVDALPVDQDAVRVATIQYAGYPITEFPLSKYSSSRDAITHLKNITFLPGVTRTGYALRKAETELFKKARGARDNAEKVVVLFSDGLSIDDATKPSRYLRREKGVKIYVVSVSADGFDEDMLNIAGFKEWTFGPNDLEKLTSTLLEDVEKSRYCSEGRLYDQEKLIPLRVTLSADRSTETTTTSPAIKMVKPVKPVKKEKAAPDTTLAPATYAATLITAATAVLPTEPLLENTDATHSVPDMAATDSTLGVTITEVPLELGEFGETTASTEAIETSEATTETPRTTATVELSTESTTPATDSTIVSIESSTEARTESTSTEATEAGTKTTTPEPQTTSPTPEPIETIGDALLPINALANPFIPHSKIIKVKKTRKVWRRRTTAAVPLPAEEERRQTAPTKLHLAMTERDITLRTVPPFKHRSTVAAESTPLESTTTPLALTTRRRRAFAARNRAVGPGTKCPLDILFVVDSSSSVRAYYDQQKDFLLSLLGGMDVAEQTHRVALLQFAGKHLQKTEWTFDRFAESQSLMMSAFHGVRYMTGTTYIGAALKTARHLLNDRRRGVDTIVVLLSDGFSQDDATQPAESILALEDCQFYAVSLSKVTNTDSLEQLTGGKDSVFVGDDVQFVQQRLKNRFHCQV